MAGETSRRASAVRARPSHGASAVKATLGVLEAATAGIATAEPADRRSEEFKAFRTGLGHCSSVAVAAAPGTGGPAFEALIERAAVSSNRDRLSL